ncbi:MAG: hypothetical protein OXT09_10210 [Myxococcales bacterium]|nr:hypothetical protein [Myxococcales bacterium]
MTSGGDPRRDVLRRLCKDAAVFASTAQVMRASFATAVLDEHCLDPAST